MPTYDYECTECGHTFDAFQSMSDAPLESCPECGKPTLRRLIGGGMGVIFKGSGFYATDNRSKAAAGKNGSGSSSGSTDDSGSKSSTDKSKKTDAGSTVAAGGDKKAAD